jgi:hypothetical protein
MCWSETATLSMVGLGAAATVIAVRRGEARAIWVAMGYFTAMEALQAIGYTVVDQCGDPLNRGVTVLSYLHIAFQPLVVNAFVLALLPEPVSERTRRVVMGLAGLAAILLLMRLVPLPAAPCPPGDALCGPAFCTVSGSWHIAWEMPLNSPWRVLFPWLGSWAQFPVYVLAMFVLPLTVGAWRFVLFHALFGPVLALALTDNMNEMPAVWCLFSVGLLILGLSPAVRRQIAPAPRRA